VEKMGGRRETAYTLAGLGDLVTTATSASSHHRHIGAELAAGRSSELAATGVNIRSEGVHTAAMVREHAVFAWERFELFALVCDFLHDPAQLEQRLGAYIARRFSPIAARP
jgi:glycerol-3-phosphate dehydrogenase (NAD(P)+)